MAKKRKKNVAAREFRLGDEFDQNFDELISKGFLERVGTDDSDGEPQYILTEKATEVFELMDFVKAADAILKEHGKK